MSVSCPDCGAAAPPASRLCPACGFPLMLSPRADEAGQTPLDLLRKPGDGGSGAGGSGAGGPGPGAPSPTGRLPTTSSRTLDGPAGWPGQAVAGGHPGRGSGSGSGTSPRACRQCEHVSAPARVRCERCGAVLAERRPEFPGPAAARRVPLARRRPAWPLVAGAVAIVAAAVGAGLYIGLRGNGDPAPGGNQVDTDPAGTAAAVTVPRGTIRATASSTRPSRSGTAYSIANTLDGDPGTAWNGDGARDGTGRGIVLTYRFDRLRHLTRITLSNGYLHSARLADVWHANGRLRRVRLTTDTGSRDLSLKDASTPQTLNADLGVTRTLKITVLSVYPGSTYPDLALTEIAFKALPGASV